MRCAPWCAPGTPRDVLEGVPVAYVPGDLTDPASVARAMQGCQAAIHCAADYRIWVPDPARMFAVNVEGTRAVMQAALAAGLRARRACLLRRHAEAARRRPARRPRPTPPGRSEAIGPYKRSKTEAERVVEAWSPSAACRR